MSDNLLIPDQVCINHAVSFISGFSSVVLGTVKDSQKAHTSYAPFIAHAGNFYVYVSGLAEHSHTLQNGSASLLFIEDEQQAKTIFARTRLTIDCTAQIIEASNLGKSKLLDQFERRHGSTVKLLRSLPDFILFELKPLTASFVTGFGAAYNVTSNLDELTDKNAFPSI